MGLPRWINYFVLQKLHGGGIVIKKFAFLGPCLSRWCAKLPQIWQRNFERFIITQLCEASWVLPPVRSEPTKLKSKKLVCFSFSREANDSESVQEILHMDNNNVIWWQKRRGHILPICNSLLPHFYLFATNFYFFACADKYTNIL